MAGTNTGLYTTIINTSGVKKKFSFLPPHGRELAAGASLSFPGTLVDIVRRYGGGPRCQRIVKSIETALKNNLLDVRQTPDVVLYDPTNARSKRLKLNNNILYAADATWEATSSSTSL